MKIKFYSCLLAIAILSLTTSCSKENILIEDETNNTEHKLAVETQEEKLSSSESTELAGIDSNSQSKSLDNQLNIQTEATIPLPTGGYYLYINMDNVEIEYTSNASNPNFSGPFNLFYRDLMSQYFTIHDILESTNSSCGNVERWWVDLAELNQYLTSIGIEEVGSNDENDWYITLDDPPGSNTSDPILTDVNGNKKKKKKNNEEILPPPTSQWLINYSHCFTI